MRISPCLSCPLVLLMTGAPAAAAVFEVACPGAPLPAAYSTINAALAAAQAAAPWGHVIQVSGNCAEQVTIAGWTNLQILGQNGATLTFPATAAYAPVLSISGSHRVTIAGFDIIGRANPPVDLVRVSGSLEFLLRDVTIRDGGGPGLYVQSASNAGLLGVRIENNQSAGVVALGSNVGLGDSTSTPSVVRGNGADGIRAAHGAHVQLSGAASIEDNRGNGLELQASSALLFGVSGGVKIAGNTIGMALSSGSRAYSTGSLTVENNNGDGFSLSASGVDLNGAGAALDIRQNAGNGVTAGANSSVKLQSAAVTANTGRGVFVIDNSTAFLANSNVTANQAEGVSAASLSVLVIGPANTVRWNGNQDVACEANSHGRGHGRCGPDIVSGL